MRLVHLTGPALRLLAVHATGEDGKVELAGRRPEMLALGRCVAFHLARAEVNSSRARRVLVHLHDELMTLGGGTCDLSSAAQCAEVLLFARSRRRPRPMTSGPPAPDTTHRLSVELEHVAPPVRRTLELSSRATLQDLHEALILAFEWSDAHLHAFELGSRRFGEPRADQRERVEDERDVTIAAALPRPGDRMTWEYDFGDSWRHAIVVDAISEAPCPRPRLLFAERAAPPEDCGGPPGYEHMLAALADRGHEDHEAMLEWTGGGFDPEPCDAKKLDERLGRMEARASEATAVILTP